MVNKSFTVFLATKLIKAKFRNIKIYVNVKFVNEHKKKKKMRNYVLFLALRSCIDLRHS